MPRICKSDGEPLDLCYHHFPADEDKARRLYAGKEMDPDTGEDRFAHNPEHPDYDGDDYRCHVCESPLMEMDN